MESVAEGIRRNPHPASLGSQDRKCAQLPDQKSPAKAKSGLQQIWMASTREQANRAFDSFVARYQARYCKATERLKKDRDTLLASDDFPAEHWVHVRTTTNPVESTFATVRLRTAKTRRCVPRNTILAQVFRLGLSTEKRWTKLR